MRARRGLIWAVLVLVLAGAATAAAAQDPAGLEAGEWRPGQAPLTRSEGYLRIVKRAEVLAALQQEGRDRREATLARRRAAESGIAGRRGGETLADLRRRALARYRQALSRAHRKLQREQDATSQGESVEGEAPSQGDTTTGNEDSTTPTNGGTDTGTVPETPAPQP